MLCSYCLTTYLHNEPCRLWQGFLLFKGVVECLIEYLSSPFRVFDFPFYSQFIGAFVVLQGFRSKRIDAVSFSTNINIYIPSTWYLLPCVDILAYSPAIIKIIKLLKRYIRECNLYVFRAEQHTA